MAYHKTNCLFGSAVYTKTGAGVIAQKSRDGKIRLIHPGAGRVVITRSQAFRYWDKHFPGRFADDLPAPIAEAVFLQPYEEAGVAIDAATCSRVAR